MRPVPFIDIPDWYVPVYIIGAYIVVLLALTVADYLERKLGSSGK